MADRAKAINYSQRAWALDAGLNKNTVQRAISEEHGSYGDTLDKMEAALIARERRMIAHCDHLRFSAPSLYGDAPQAGAA